MTTTCKVFALCDNPATTTRQTVAISNGELVPAEIPACQRCVDKMNTIHNLDN